VIKGVGKYVRNTVQWKQGGEGRRKKKGMKERKRGRRSWDKELK